MSSHKSPVTTLCYIEQDGKYLMMHRTKKKNDINEHKWVGIGGHAEEGESPEDCLLRETREETGLELSSFRFRGLVTFAASGETEYMCLYTANAFSGTLTDCDEGTLEWIPKEEISRLNLWTGDLIFFRLLKENVPFFSLKLCYDEKGTLCQWQLNGRDMGKALPSEKKWKEILDSLTAV